jgi:hypothetical protein
VKPGDLVKLVNSRELLSMGIGVAVSWNVSGRGEHLPTSFPEGTAAVFLRADSVEYGLLGRRPASFILIGGRMGWVWPQELEPL